MRKLSLMKIQVSKMPMYDSTEEMDHLRSRLAAAEQQQVGSAGTMCHRVVSCLEASSGLELRKLLDAELAGAQVSSRSKFEGHFAHQILQLQCPSPDSAPL